VSEAIVVSDAVRVPSRAMTVHAVRASGPGGQNVNKVAGLLRAALAPPRRRVRTAPPVGAAP
jgi:protein subunit release factor B